MKLTLRSILPVALLLATVLGWTACSGDATQSQAWPQHLVVGTVYSPTTFFILRGDTMGYDHDRIIDLAVDKGIDVEFKVAPNMNALIGMLNAGEIDIIAAQVPNSGNYQRQVINCGSINETRPVLVQHSGNARVTDMAQLAGSDIYVEAHSNLENVLTQVNSQLGGTVNIHSLPEDSVSTDDLLDMVSKGEITYTIVDSDIAQFNAARYDSIDVSLTMGSAQTSSWAVSLSNKWLADSIDAWCNSTNGRTYSKAALERYVKKSRVDESQPDLSNELPQIGSRRPAGERRLPHSSGPVHYSGPVSPSSFDQLFQRYGGSSAWDWHLLSAVARVESNYNPNAHSWAGARGLMQVMPGTARGHGVNPDMLYDPEVNVRLGAQILRELNKTFQNRIPDRNERLKFVLASYNAGAGHVLDAMALAAKYGRNPQVWYGNVEEMLLWKSNPQYYNDPVCRYGYCRGRETVGYVKSVLSRYR